MKKSSAIKEREGVLLQGHCQVRDLVSSSKKRLEKTSTHFGAHGGGVTRTRYFYL